MLDAQKDLIPEHDIDEVSGGSLWSVHMHTSYLTSY